MPQRKVSLGMIIVLMIITGFSWGPVFHQVIADEFASQYLPHLSHEQHESLVMGATYLDALPKPKFHELSYLIELANEIENMSSPEYYFHLGLILHITVDFCGHMGYPYSYLPIGRPFHYVGEMVVCSAIYHDRHPKKLPSNQFSDYMMKKLANRSSRKFATFCKLYRTLVKMPFHILLSKVESDGPGRKCRNNFAFYNLEQHMVIIKNMMMDTLCMLSENLLTGNRLWEACRAELNSTSVCS